MACDLSNVKPQLSWSRAAEGVALSRLSAWRSVIALWQCMWLNGISALISWLSANQPLSVNTLGVSQLMQCCGLGGMAVGWRLAMQASGRESSALRRHYSSLSIISAVKGDCRRRPIPSVHLIVLYAEKAVYGRRLSSFTPSASDPEVWPWRNSNLCILLQSLHDTWNVSDGRLGKWWALWSGRYGKVSAACVTCWLYKKIHEISLLWSRKKLEEKSSGCASTFLLRLFCHPMEADLRYLNTNAVTYTLL